MRVVTVVRRTIATRLARGAAWAEAAVLRWCLVAVEELVVSVAELANDAQTKALPTAQDTIQRDSCLNFRETEELEASCITICFSLKQRKNPRKIKSLRGLPQPDVERVGQLVTSLGGWDGTVRCGTPAARQAASVTAGSSTTPSCASPTGKVLP